jgi:glycosyltransferase involved in cell wall biosynthesis
MTGEAMTGEATATEAMPGLRVAVVLGVASGGTALHAGMLAEGCRRAGLAVIALGPASTREPFAAAAGSLPRPEAVSGAESVPGPGSEAVAGPGPESVPGPGSEAVAGPGPESVPGPGPGAVAGPGPESVPGPGSGAVSGPERDSRASGGAAGAIPFHVVDISDRPRPARDAAAVLRLRRLLGWARPDVAHAHGLRAGALAALALTAWRRDQRPALVVTVHNAAPPGRAARLVYGLLERACAQRADAVLCASADLAARMRRLGAARVAEFDVPAPPAPPPEGTAVRAARAGLGPPGRPVILAAGRLAEQKGLDVLLAAAGQWQDREPVPLLALAGEGPLAGELAATARRSGMELMLLGQRDDVPALLAAADVVVVPSRWEARALIVQEAMRAGRPIVASRVGGIPALTGEDAALLVPPGDAGRLAEAVVAVLDDAALAARLAAAAQARAAALPGLAEAVAAVLAVYRELAGPR